MTCLEGSQAELCDLSHELFSLSLVIDCIALELPREPDGSALRERVRTVAMWLLDVIEEPASLPVLAPVQKEVADACPIA